MRKQVIYINLDKTDRNILFSIKKREDIELHLVISENNMPYMLNNEFVRLYVKQSDGEIMEFEPKQITGNDRYFMLDSTATTVVGLLQCEITIRDNEGVLKSKDFYGLIQKAVSIGITETYDLMDIEYYLLMDINGFYLKVRG